VRIALVHDWLTGMRGGEKCLEVACDLLPDAPLFTLIHKPGSVSAAIERRPIVTSPLQSIPGVFDRYRKLLPLFPWAASRWNLSGFDAVLSFSHCVAKSARVAPHARHVCYCFTPMRYVWGMEEDYFAGRMGAVRPLLDGALAALRSWDRRTASRTHEYIAISHYIARRIRRAWGRASDVLYPPVDTEFYTPGSAPPEDFFLIVSALAPYKRIDLAVEAFRKLGQRLVIIGGGQDEARLRASAPSNVEFLGPQSDEVLRDHYRRCRAFVFPGEEDFGITPLEAQACGRPVIALGRGGATETVIDRDADPVRATGVLFEPQTVDGLVDAVRRFDSLADRFSPDACRANALRFRKQVFRDGLSRVIESLMSGSARAKK